MDLQNSLLGPEVVNQLGGSSWSDEDEIRQIVAAAGWQDITLEVVEFEVRMPATDDIARGQIERALGRTQFDDEIKKARRAIEADMLAILEVYRVGDPCHSHPGPKPSVQVFRGYDSGVSH